MPRRIRTLMQNELHASLDVSGCFACLQSVRDKSYSKTLSRGDVSQ